MQRRRPNPPGWTTAVGLGYDHQQARAQALRELRDGIDCCPYCRRPMYRRGRLDLDDYPPRIIAALLHVTPVKRLSHRKCNRSAGAKLGNALRKRGITRRPQRPRQQRAAQQRSTRRRTW